MRTAKGGATRKGPDFPAFWEGVLAVLLLVGAVIVVLDQLQADPRDQHLCALVLVVQSLPFLAAVAIAAMEGSRFNEFAFWRGVEAQACAARACSRRRGCRVERRNSASNRARQRQRV